MYALQQNMWFKQAASSMWNATKSILTDQRSPPRRLLDDIQESQEQIISTAKLNELANLTFDLQTFQQIVEIVIERIRVFKYDLDEAHKNLNMLIVINYLIKHGASAFVDELREYIPTFKKYQTLQQLKTYEQQQKQTKLVYQLEKIKSRANHIQTLLQDKQKLLKEKELSMLIKQKLKLYEKQKMDAINNSKQGDSKQSIAVSAAKGKEMNQKMNKLEWMMEKYLWQYVDKLDGKIEQVSDKVLQQVDKYIIGEIPEKFQLQDDHQFIQNSSPAKRQENYQQIGEDDDLMKRLEAQIQEGGVVGVGQVVNDNLLQFQEVVQEPHPKPVVHNDTLI